MKLGTEGDEAKVRREIAAMMAGGEDNRFYLACACRTNDPDPHAFHEALECARRIAEGEEEVPDGSVAERVREVYLETIRQDELAEGLSAIECADAYAPKGGRHR